jgi:tubulin delta
MEPKVVNSCLDINNGLWKYDPCYSYINIYFDRFVNQEGSGNNWSYGFNSHGPKCQEKIFEKFYKMLENTDYVDGVVFM